MWKKHDLVMLPTTNRSIINIDSFGKMFGLSPDSNISFEDCVGQHLYITSNDEVINERDWFIYRDLFICQLHEFDRVKNKYRIFYNGNEDYLEPEFCKKILAATDESLYTIISRPLGVTRVIPQIPQLCVDLFIIETQTGIKISEVFVEYEKGMCGAWEDAEFFERMIVNADNTINVKLTIENNLENLYKISSVNYGDDGVGLEQHEIDKLL